MTQHVIGKTGEYDVTFGHHHDAEGQPIWTCSCPAWWYAKQPDVAQRECKHIRQVREELAEKGVAA